MIEKRMDKNQQIVMKWRFDFVSSPSAKWIRYWQKLTSWA